MTQTQKRKKIRQLVSKYVTAFNLGFDVLVDFKPELEEEEDVLMPQFLRFEELLVTRLERSIMGEERWAEMLVASEKRVKAKALAVAEDEHAHYNRFKLTFFDALLEMGRDDFLLFAESVVLHEVLHMVVWPLSSYTETLEGTHAQNKGLYKVRKTKKDRGLPQKRWACFR